MQTTNERVEKAQTSDAIYRANLADDIETGIHPHRMHVYNMFIQNCLFDEKVSYETTSASGQSTWYMSNGDMRTPIRHIKPRSDNTEIIAAIRAR